MQIFSLRVIQMLLLGIVCTPMVAVAFSDVDDKYPYEKAITYVQNEGIVSGYADGSFRPEQMINRAEFTKIIVNSFYKQEVQNVYLCHNQYKEDLMKCDGTATCEKVAFSNFGACVGYASDANGNPSPQSEVLHEYDACFPDVSMDVWYGKFVCHAKMKGLLGGYPDGTFKPEQNVSFVEAAKILSNAFGFTTTKDAIWYRPYVGALADRQAIPSTIIHFSENISRAELAEMLYRLREKITTKDSMSYASLQ